MKIEYDFANMVGHSNPYAKMPKKFKALLDSSAKCMVKKENNTMASGIKKCGITNVEPNSA